MSDTRNHTTTRDQLTAHFIAGVDQPRQGMGQTIPSPAVCCLTCGWMSAGDYEEHLVAAVRAAAVAETTATIEAVLAPLEADGDYNPYADIRAALSGGRTTLDTAKAAAWDEALEAVANERGSFGMQTRNPYRADTGADQ